MKPRMILTAILFVMTLPLIAATEMINGYTWTYRINGNTAEIYNGNSCAVSPQPTGVMTLPSKLGGKPVTSIGASALSGCSGLTSITIPNSVTNIGSKAFSGCSGMTSVIMAPARGMHVFNGAFSGCSSLSAVRISDVAAWCEAEFSSAYESCNPLTIAHNLYTTTLVKDLIVPEGVMQIGRNAFSGSRIVNVELPNTVTNIGAGAFNNCAELETIVIPDSVTGIGDAAFASCSKLTSAPLPRNLVNLGDYAFEYCSSLTSVTMPEHVTSIGYMAFYGCSRLTGRLVIPDSVKSIGHAAFQSCYGLTDVIIGNGVTNIGISAFWNCSGMESAIIGNTVANIGSYAFNSCYGLTSLTIPNSVTNIGEQAFNGCSGLKWVVCSESLKTVGVRAFASCSSLQAVYMLGGVPSTGGNIYEGTPTNLTTYVSDIPAWWIFPDIHELPETWPSKDDEYGRRIEIGAPTFVSVAFDANGGSLMGVPLSVTRLAGFEMGFLPGAILEGSALIGWYTERDGGVHVTANTIVTPGMETLYAHWGDDVALVSGGDADWTHEIDGSWRSGAVGSAQTSWMSATVYGEGEVSFKWKVSSSLYYAKLYFYVDGVQKEYVGGSIGWTDKKFIVSGNGEHTLMWAYSKTYDYTSGSDCGWVDAIVWAPYEECEITFNADGGSLDAATAARCVYKGWPIGDLPLPTKGDYMFAGWWSADGVKVTAETIVTGAMTLTARWERNPFMIAAGSNWMQEGDGGWKSGPTAHGATNVIAMSVSGEGTVVFNWKTSCEGFFRSYRLDYLAFFVDGEEQCFINGQSEWERVEFEVLGSGEHSLVWSYIKDEEGESGSDCAWLRDVVWTSIDKPFVSVGEKGTVEAVDCGYVVTATEGKTLTEGDINFALDREAYTVNVASDGKSATVMLNVPLVGVTVGESGVLPDPDDQSGLLVLVDESKVSARPEAKSGEAVGVLPVKAHEGLWYQAAWGADIGELTEGEKVRAASSALYIGVIKQTGDKGFYKLKVSEK